VAKHNIVIVGGGFGGTKAALELARDHRFNVTLIHNQPDFSYYPTMYETATGVSKRVASIPLEEIFSELPINLVQDTVVDIDRHSQTVITALKSNFHYDGLILSLGVETNYFHIEGLQEFAYGIKSISDAERFKDHLHKQIIEEGKADINYVVVGAGPTGVELAGVLPDYVRKISKHHGLSPKNLHVDLIEAAPRVLPRSPKDLSRRVASHLKKVGVKLYLNTAVQAETADQLMVNNKPIRSHTVVWTSGVSNSPFFTDHGFQISDKHKVRVDQFLQAEHGIYVIGDNSDTPYSGMAQTAVYDGVFVANNIKKIASGQDPDPYKAKKPIYVFAAGHNWSAVLWGPVRFYGRKASWLRKMADLLGYHDYEPWKLATQRLMAESSNEESCPICATSIQDN
jgi:NADH dehydrogenase